MNARRKVVFLAICSGDRTLIERWASSGHLRAIGGLMRNGLVGRTVGLPGVFVGAHWPSFMTGCHPGKNRVHSWRQLRPGSYEQYRCRAGDHLQRRPFWESLSEAGRRVCILDVPHSRLSSGLNGLQTVEWGAHDAAYGFHASSAALEAEIRERFGLHPVSGDSDRMLDPSNPLAFRDQLLEGVSLKGRLTRHFLKRERWDLFAQVFTEAHCAGHLLWYLHDPDYRWHFGAAPAGAGDALLDVYVAIDAAIGEILAEVDIDTTVVLLANHGIGPKYNANHLFDRVLVALGYAAPAAPSPPAPVSWRSSIDPLLTQAWQTLPTGVRTRLKPLQALKRRVVNAERPPAAVIDPATSRAFSVTNNSAHAAVRINLQGREPQGRVRAGSEYRELLTALEQDLLSLINADTGARVVEAVHRCDDLYPGPERDHLPDLFVQWTNDAPVDAVASPRLPRIEGQYRYVRSGEHRSDGLFIVRGPGIAPGTLAAPAQCMDFAPTIAAWLDVSLPADIDGRALPLQRD